KAHILEQRLPKVPNVDSSPSYVVRADGSSCMQWTISPCSRITLTRDTTENPL
ncbi:hypothetical protein BDR07DRAFT_1278462, partial [Suillus spraguei]